MQHSRKKATRFQVAMQIASQMSLSISCFSSHKS